MHPTFLKINNQSLCDYTTLEVGGKVTYFAEIASLAQIDLSLDFAQKQGLAIYVLGGGSNLLCSDHGIDGFVIYLQALAEDQAIKIVEDHEDYQIWEIWAGTPWSVVVEKSLQAQLQGIECLIGIPGKVGAAPVQNIGAYGQSFHDVGMSVSVIDLDHRQRITLSKEECHWSYRHSIFKEKSNYLITHVRIKLNKKSQNIDISNIQYQQLAQRLTQQYQSQSFDIQQIAQTVKMLRAEKSMLWDPNDPNHRSAGSFFTNPIVDLQQYEYINQIATAKGKKLVSWPDPLGMKLSAGWLIENAGCPPSYQCPEISDVALSSKHSLCIINLGKAKASSIQAFAKHIQTKVFDQYGVLLKAEVVYWGF